jgi:thioredoxin-like negative regulator of GroEL
MGSTSQLAVEYVKSNVKFLFQEAEIPGTAMFDVRLKAGTIIILFNTKHPAREHFFELLKQEGAEADTPAQKALKLLLSARARLEDEAAGSGRKQVLEDARLDWGRLARDFLQAANE